MKDQSENNANKLLTIWKIELWTKRSMRGKGGENSPKLWRHGQIPTPWQKNNFIISGKRILHIKQSIITVIFI